MIFNSLSLLYEYRKLKVLDGGIIYGKHIAKGKGILNEV